MKRALADILWTAANKHLAVPGGRYGDTDYYSCNAVALATGDDADATALPRPIKEFLGQCGCDINSSNAFGDYPLLSEVTQGARYMWLLLAAKVAEDEKIYVEVA